MQDYEKTQLLDLLEAIEFSSKEKPAILQDKDFKFELTASKSEASENFSLTVRSDKDILFVLDLVKYDKFHFYENVHQPFGWDSEARDRFSEGEWQTFLSEKNAWTDCPIEVMVRIQDLKITDEDTVDKIVNSIGLHYVLEDIYQNTLNDFLDVPSVEVTNTPTTPEENAVCLVIDKISAIKNRI